ncbi:plasmid Maintenance Protein [Dictyocaulus viviparus]|uniref:Mannosyltransferase n=1 Tax=Dictyocaulus viviparus TaxID=29172 RepID=A0A0D8XMZ1_DICVI|nr:plasmid Maintenance Protein [Dictyocaulus viviparus]
MLSTGMFIASSAFLPSSFAMTMNMYAMAAFLNEKCASHHRFYAIICTAISALIGWPFAAILGMPVVIDMLFFRPKVKMFWYFTSLSGIFVGGILLSFDSYYYGKRVLAPLNIVLYNVFSEHGPDIYGVEPLSYYLKNLILNWNIAVFLIPLAVPLSVLNYFHSWKALEQYKKWGIPLHPLYWRHYSPIFLIYITLVAWCIIFFNQSHKEERFLFPIYPLIALLAAVSLDSAERLINRYIPSFSFVSWLTVMFFILASISRTFALHKNFSAHIEIYKSLNEHLMEHQRDLDFSLRADPLRLCVGKEWYRFPSSFFLPEVAVDSRNIKREINLHFLKSEYSGALPNYYPQGRLPFITRRIPAGMNDMNKEEPSRYVELDTCDYVIDLETPDHVLPHEPNFGAMVYYFSSQSNVFRRLYAHLFLISSKSHWFYRAFFIPYLSVRRTSFANYTLYERIPPTVRA